MKGNKVAKKKPAKATSKKAPAKIKHNEYLIMREGTVNFSTVNFNRLVSTEPTILDTAKEMIESTEDTVLIYQLVKKVRTSQELKIEDCI